MHVRTTRGCALSLVAGLVLTCLACGGGGGGGGPTPPPPGPDLLNGPYHFVDIDAFSGPPEEMTTRWGLITADGAGTSSVTFTANDSGTVSGPIGGGGAPYTVAPDRTMTWQGGLFAGGVAADGGAAIMGTTGGSPEMLLMIKRSGTFATSSLNGTYHFHALELDPGLPPEHTSYWGTASFDGAGALTVSLQANDDGVITPPFMEGGTYSVAADGTVTIDFGGGFVLQGGLREGGMLGFVAGAINTGETPFVATFVPTGAGLSDATLGGTYFLGMAQWDLGGGIYVMSYGTVVSGGAGALTATLTHNEEGLVTTEPPVAVAYSVMPNGATTLTVGPDTFPGCISPDGRFGVFAGGSNPGSNPTLIVVLR